MSRYSERYSTNTDEETRPILGLDHGAEEGEEATNSWFSTASIIVCAMAGVGVLSLPSAMYSGGWIGVPLLVFCAVCNMYTGVILGKAMKQVKGVKNYDSIGEAAFGRPGLLITRYSVYVTLVGVAIIFLILLGILLNGIFPKVPTGFWTLMGGIFLLAPLASALRTFGEIKFISWFGFSATAIVVVASVILAAIFYNSDKYDHERHKHGFSHQVLNKSAFAIAFSAFTFAFGATAIFPNVYHKLQNKGQWSQSVIGGYTTSLSLYLPVAVAGYLVYGSYLGEPNVSTVLDAIADFDSGASVVVKIMSGIMVAHIVSAFPIVINPVFLAVEGFVLYRNDPEAAQATGFMPNFKRIGLRMAICCVLVVVALFFPYFLDVMSLVSDLSVTITGYILPPLFYWKLCNPHPVEKVLLVFIILFGLTGSGVGIYESVKQLISDVKANSNPFQGLFTFG